MTGFLVAVAVLILVALVLLLPPLFRKKHSLALTKDDVSVALFRAKQAELDEDVKRGTISADEHRRADLELQKEVLTDNVGVEAPVATSTAARWTGVLVAAFVPLMAGTLYLFHGSPQLLQTPPQTAPETLQAAAGEIEVMLDRLASRLASDPNDIEGWRVLARSYTVLERYGEAVLALQRAREIAGDDPTLLADHAEVLGMMNGGRLNDEAHQLIEESLARDPEHKKSLWLAGVAAYQRNQLEPAISYWKQLETLHPAGTEGQREVGQYIEMATAELQGDRSKDTKPVGQPGAEPIDQSAAVSLDVMVRIAESLAHRAEPDDSVFVFARAPDGPKAPLAVVRKRVSDLPITLRLDDSTTMTSAVKLSDYAQVVVGARVSKSGKPIAQAGDLQGLSDLIATGGQDVINVTIDQIVP